MTTVHLPVSIGEALDKLSILQIKAKYIQDPEKVTEVQKEIHAIYPLLESYVAACKVQYDLLVQVNERIWTLIDIARQNGTTDPIVMRENDARFRVKKKINVLCNSSLREQKNFSANALCMDIEMFDDHIIQEIRRNSVYYDVLKLKYVGAPKKAWDVVIALQDAFADDPWIVVMDP